MKGRSALPRFAYLLGLLVVAGILAFAIWGQELLASFSYFNVRRIEVVGARWVAPDALLELADIKSDRSVWEDFSGVEARIAAHPVIEEARIQRSGLHALRVVVREAEPVALVGVPELRVVRDDGRLLPLQPQRGSIDLPVLTNEATLTEDSARLEVGPALDAVRLLAALHALDPGLTAIVSDFEMLGDSDFVMNLVTSQPAHRITLPAKIDERLVRRVRATLADLRRRGIEATVIEARYADQIVVRREQA